VDDDKPWHEVLPPRVVAWARERLRTRNCEESCVDNERVALISSPSQMRRFRKQRDNGCCGSDEWGEVFEGERYLFGYNYGH
jgi:hypothetical protein